MKGLLSILFIMPLMYFSCSKPESTEDKWMDGISRIWELADGNISWDVPLDNPVYSCYHSAGLRLNPDQKINGMIPIFNLEFHRNGTYDLYYSIPLEHVFISCNYKEYEVEQPVGIQRLEERDQGTFTLIRTERSGVLARDIYFESSSGQYLSPSSPPVDFCHSTSHGTTPCNLNIRFLKFEKLFTLDLRLHAGS